MTLNEWMRKTGTRAAEIAAFVGCDRSYISLLKVGKANPSLAVMDLIAIFTDAQVGREDWPSPVPDSVRKGQPAGSPAEPTAPTEQS